MDKSTASFLNRYSPMEGNMKIKPHLKEFA